VNLRENFLITIILIRRWIKDAYFVRSLYERMKEIPDPRCDRKKTHECADMLTYMIMGFLSGRTAIRRSLTWASSHEKLLKKYMGLDGGIASASTISRLMSGIDEEIFALTFADWAMQLLNACGMHIIIDGKALRGATRKIRDEKVPYILNAVEAATEIVIAQMPIDAKSNEITAIPEFIDRIDVEGSIVTIDAIGTQTTIMKELERRNAGFLLQVKKNQPQMYEDIIGFFNEIESEKKEKKENPSYIPSLQESMEKCSRYQTAEKNRERYEYRDYMACSDVSCLSKGEEMPYIKTVAISNQTRIMTVKDALGTDITPDLKTFLAEGSAKQPRPEQGDSITDSIQVAGMVSNRILNAEEIGTLKREHWVIENGLHHVLDDAFREDRSPAKGSKNNLALIRKIAYNIIRYALATLKCNKGVIEMMDYFADNPEQTAKYIFEPLLSLH